MMEHVEYIERQKGGWAYKRTEDEQYWWWKVRTIRRTEGRVDEENDWWIKEEKECRTDEYKVNKRTKRKLTEGQR